MSQCPHVLQGPVFAASPVVLAQEPLSEMESLSPRERELERRACERGRAEGFGAGRSQGLAEGRRAAEAELGGAAQALAAALRDFAANRQRFLACAKESVLRLALAVARKIVHAEVRSSAEGAARVVDAAIARAGDASVLRVRVRPCDKERIERTCPGRAPAELTADPSISPGGCVVETEYGSIDATVESQWEAVQATLEEAVAEEAAGDVTRGS